MKNLFTFWRNPNESNGSTCRGLNGGRMGVTTSVKRLSNDCRMTLDRVSTLFLLLIALSFGFSSQAWGSGKQEQKGWQAADTAYVVTPTISTQDTLYLKYEDAKATATTWWERYGCQAILLTIIGAGITLFTTWVTNKQERKRRKQDLKDEQAIETEKKIYNLIVALRNATDKNREDAIHKLAIELQEAELTMRTPLYLTAAQILTLYQNGGDSDALNQLPEEQMLLEQYKKHFLGEV